MTLLPTIIVCVLSFYLGYLFFKFLESIKVFVVESDLEPKIKRVDKMIKIFNLVMEEREKAKKGESKNPDSLFEAISEIGFLKGQIFGIEDTLKRLKKTTFIQIEKEYGQKKEK